MKQPMTGSKKSVATANGSNKPMRQVETSMSKKYKGTPKVSQATIDSIKKMGMTAALKKAGSSKNPEYIEGIKRMYGAKRLAAAQGGAAKPVAKKAFSPAQKTAMGMGAAKKAAAPAAKKSSGLTPAQAAEAKWRSGDRYNNTTAKKKTTTSNKSGSTTGARRGGSANSAGGR